MPIYMVPNTLAPAVLAGVVRAHVPIGSAELRIAPIATGKHNASFRMEGGPRALVLRVPPPDDAGLLFYERRMMRQEPAVHALVRERTSP